VQVGAEASVVNAATMAALFIFTTPPSQGHLLGRSTFAPAGEGNNYGHPHEEVLERAADVGAAVLRTDELGTIEVITDGEQMWWASCTQG